MAEHEVAKLLLNGFDCSDCKFYPCQPNTSICDEFIEMSEKSYDYSIPSMELNRYDEPLYE